MKTMCSKSIPIHVLIKFTHYTDEYIVHKYIEYKCIVYSVSFGTQLEWNWIHNHFIFMMWHFHSGKKTTGRDNFTHSNLIWGGNDILVAGHSFKFCLKTHLFPWLIMCRSISYGDSNLMMLIYRAPLYFYCTALWSACGCF